VRGRQDPAHELDGGHGQLQAHAELLLDLGRVPVADRLERPHDARALGGWRALAGLAPALARADLALHDDRPRRIDEARTRERQEGQERGRRVAARAGDELRRPDLVTMELRDPVHRRAEQLRMRMVAVVPLAVARRVTQPMIRRQIDDERSARPELREPVRAVGQRQEQDVAPGDLVVAHEVERRAFPEVRMGDRDRLPCQGLAARDDVADLGVAGEQPQELTAGVATGADDADLHQRSATLRA